MKKVGVRLLWMVIGLAMLIEGYTQIRKGFSGIKTSVQEKESSAAEAVITDVSYDEIYTAYQANVLRADESYKGNYYRLTAEIYGMDNDGIMNITGGATLLMRYDVDNTVVFFYAEFEKEQEEALKQVDVGDTVTFDGKCLDYNTWSYCKLVTE